MFIIKSIGQLDTLHPMQLDFSWNNQLFPYGRYKVEVDKVFLDLTTAFGII